MADGDRRACSHKRQCAVGHGVVIAAHRQLYAAQGVQPTRAQVWIRSTLLLPIEVEESTSSSLTAFPAFRSEDHPTKQMRLSSTIKSTKLVHPLPPSFGTAADMIAAMICGSKACGVKVATGCDHICMLRAADRGESKARAATG